MFSNTSKLFITGALLALFCFLFLKTTIRSAFSLRPTTTLQEQSSLNHQENTMFNSTDGQLGTANTEVAERDFCTLPHCEFLLSKYDRSCIEWCSEKTFKNESVRVTGECEFMRGEGRAPVALVSLPGSGNTWIRGLLEKTTGICTGSLYCDSSLRREAFDAESVVSGSVLVVKTHRSRYLWTHMRTPPKYPDKFQGYVQPSFGAAILLLRNPYHALVAEWNRQKSNKTLSADALNTTIGVAAHIAIGDQKTFGTNEDWTSVIHIMMKNFRNYVRNVILESPRDLPKLVVRYEDFQRDRVGEVSRVLDFLHFPYSRETLSQRLEEDFTTFHRSRHTEFEAFTQAQEQRVDHSLRQILDSLSARNNGETYGIEEYLRT